MSEAISQEPMENIAENRLNTIEAIRIDNSLPRNNPVNSGKEVIRGIIRPLFFFLVEKGLPTENLNSPQKIISAASRHPEFATEEIVKGIQEEYSPDTERNWNTEALVISLEGSKHPLCRLAQAAKEKLSESSRRQLVKTELRF